MSRVLTSALHHSLLLSHPQQRLHGWTESNPRPPYLDVAPQEDDDGLYYEQGPYESSGYAELSPAPVGVSNPAYALGGADPTYALGGGDSTYALGASDPTYAMGAAGPEYALGNEPGGFYSLGASDAFPGYALVGARGMPRVPGQRGAAYGQYYDVGHAGSSDDSPGYAMADAHGYADVSGATGLYAEASPYASGGSFYSILNATGQQHVADGSYCLADSHSPYTISTASPYAANGSSPYALASYGPAGSTYALADNPSYVPAGCTYVLASDVEATAPVPAGKPRVVHSSPPGRTPAQASIYAVPLARALRPQQQAAREGQMRYDNMDDCAIDEEDTSADQNV
jgi:hypothetical protein